MKRELKCWASWIGVLPISIVAGILVTFPVHWVLYRTLSGGDSPFITPYPELPERVLSPFFSSLVIVWVGSKIAPAHKFITAIILAAIWIFFAGVTFTMAYFGVHLGKFQYYLIGGGLPVIMGVVGSIVGLYQVRNILKGERQVVIEEKEIALEEKVENSTNTYQTDLLNLLFIGIFVLSLYYVIVRNIFFVFLLCFNVFLIIFSLREKLYTTVIMKISLAKNIVLAVVLLIGLLNQTLGLYATVFCLGLQIIDFIRHFITAHLLEKSNHKILLQNTSNKRTTNQQ